MTIDKDLMIERLRVSAEGYRLENESLKAELEGTRDWRRITCVARLTHSECAAPAQRACSEPALRVT